MTLTVAPPTDLRIRDAALVCIGRFGLAKTTVDDIAREAGCSRATLYRYFDGKPAILRAAVAGRARPRRHRTGRRRSRRADVRRRRGRGRRPRRARAARPRRVAVPARPRTRSGARPPRVRARRPRARRGRRRHRARVRPLARRRLPHVRAGDWLARLVRSYVLMPHPPVDFTDPAAARAFLERLVVPGLAENREPS